MSELKQKIVDGTYQAGDKMRRRMNWLLFIRMSVIQLERHSQFWSMKAIFMLFTAKEHFVRRWDVIQRHLAIIAVVTTYLSDYIFRLLFRELIKL